MTNLLGLNIKALTRTHSWQPDQHVPNFLQRLAAPFDFIRRLRERWSWKHTGHSKAHHKHRLMEPAPCLLPVETTPWFRGARMKVSRFAPEGRSNRAASKIDGLCTTSCATSYSDTSLACCSLGPRRMSNKHNTTTTDYHVGELGGKPG